jgi:hypothetical protein
MKPTVQSTAIAFLVLGAALAAWGFVGVLPSATQIGLGATLALTGVGLFLRARLAHRAGLVVAASSVGLGGWRLYTAIGAGHHFAIAKAGVMIAMGLYLLVSLMLVRREFASAK